MSLIPIYFVLFDIAIVEDLRSAGKFKPIFLTDDVLNNLFEDEDFKNLTLSQDSLVHIELGIYAYKWLDWGDMTFAAYLVMKKTHTKAT